MLRPVTTDADARLLAAAAASLHHTGFRLADLTPEVLALQTRSHSLEFATALWHEAVTRTEPHAAFHAAIKAPDFSAAGRPDLIAIVPGAFHRENRDTGADGARVLAIAREIGCAAEVIPVPGFGRVAANAQIVVDWLSRRRERRITLVSLSKGGSDVKRALALPDAPRAFAAVATWISFSGIVEGTPLVAWLRARPLRWWSVQLLLWLRRHPRRTLDDLRHDSNGLLASWPTLPAHLKLVHVCGVPLRRHLQHRWAPRAYERLASLGPNDGGGILLGALSRVPGIVCPIWGADHYLLPSWNATPLCRDIVLATFTREPLRHASQSAANPIAAPAIKSTT